MATGRLAGPTVCMGGVVVLLITALRAIAIVVIAARPPADRLSMAHVARISQVTRFALEHSSEDVVANSKWYCCAERSDD